MLEDALFVILQVSEGGDCSAAEGHYSSLPDSKLFKLKENSTNNDSSLMGSVYIPVFNEMQVGLRARGLFLVCGKE